MQSNALAALVAALAASPAPARGQTVGQEAVLVPEKVTSYKLVFETSLEEKTETKYQPVWQQEWRSVPHVVSRPIFGSDGRVYLHNVQEMQSSPFWTYRLAPQETVGSVPKVKALWKPYTETKLVSKQVPAGTPAPPQALEPDNGDSSASPDGTTEPKDEVQKLKEENNRLRDEVRELERDNERLKGALSEVLGSRK